VPQDRGSLRLTFIHEAHVSLETAQFHLELADVTNNPANTGVDALALLDNTAMAAIFATYTTFLTDTSGQRADYSRAIGVKAAAIGTSGKYADKILHPPVLYSDTSGWGSAANRAPQSSAVIGLRTSVTTGRRAREGRVYVPHTHPPLDSGSPYCTSANVTSLANYFSDFITALNGVSALVAVSFQVVLLSHLASAPGTPGHGTTADTHPIIAVRAGNVIDTQRRRMHQLTEVYTSVVL
jgi:hypothetical protein